MTADNRVRARREALGLSQVVLAAAARLTRQSIGAIEAGRAVPGVDVALRLARALDCRVEELFGELGSELRLNTETVGTPTKGRVALAHIAGRWVSHPLTGGRLSTSADGLLARAVRGVGEVEPVRPLGEARENIVLMGCAAALGLLADRLNSRPGPGRFLWLPGSSTAALEAIGKRRTHVAGVHLVDQATGEINVADVRRHAGSEPLVLIELGSWEAGLVTARGNPKGLRCASDLGRRGLRLVVRERGSGARRLLDRALAENGFPSLGATALEAGGHLEVAQAVALGAADVGVATRDAAIALGLHFVPLAEERYDLCIAREEISDVRVARLLEVMTGGHFCRELTALGYDVRSSGRRVAEVHCA